MDINKICPGCMRELQNKDQINCCPHCGYNLKEANTATHQLRPYTILAGKYMVGKVIGEGGFGITYLGYDLNLEIAVAIKEFYPNGFVTRESGTTSKVTIYAGNNEKDIQKWRDNFIREARSLARFSNLNGIVEVRDFFNENDTAYIVMEYIDGTTLKSHLKQCGGKIPVDQVLAMMEPVINSLAKVHETGIIHRDISPDNIMITSTGNMKLLDFGAARDISASGEKSLSVMLKPGYAPEEQYRTRGNQGPWSDVYALCATMYKCITGQTPIESMERLRSDSLKMPNELGVKMDPNKEAALARGMAVLAENRFQDMNSLHNAMYSGGAILQAPVNKKQEDLEKTLPLQAMDKTIPLMQTQAQQTQYQQPAQQTQYQQTPNQNQQAPTGNNKNIFIIVGILAAIAVVGVAIIAVLALGGNNSIKTLPPDTNGGDGITAGGITDGGDKIPPTSEAPTFNDNDREYLNSLCDKTKSCESIYDYQSVMDELCSFMETKGCVTEAMPKINEITSKYYENAYDHYKLMMGAGKNISAYAEIKITCEKASDHFNRLRNLGLEPVDYNNVQSMKEEYAGAYKNAWSQEFDKIVDDNIQNSSSHAVSRSTIWGCVSSLDNQDDDFKEYIDTLKEHNDPLGMRYRAGLALHVDELTQNLSGKDAGDIIDAYMEETEYNPLMVSMLASRAGNNRANAWMSNIDSILKKYSIAGYENKTFSQLNDLDKRNYICYLINYPNALNEIRQYMIDNYSY